MRIAFTGHRDKLTTPGALDWVAEHFPGATWVHGGAQGFDAQVDAYAREHGIPVEVVRPDYAAFAGKEREAPLARNRQIVDSCDVVIACYDGRKYGGTYYTVCYAQEDDQEGQGWQRATVLHLPVASSAQPEVR